MKVYDILGNEVETLVNQKKSAGNYSVDFDGRNHPSGIYFYQLVADEVVIETKKMAVLK